MDLSSYGKIFSEYLDKNISFKNPKNLYDPISYILKIGGKKLRPILALIGIDIFGGDWKEGLPVGLSIEVFHNFTLLHDDIMDKAMMRRNQATVHKKWNVNTAILSGDAMVILAYKYLEYYQGNTYKKMMKIFNKTALEVCEGQQLDLDFEKKTMISKQEYMEMIRLKTAVLLGSSLQLGAVIAEASEKDCEHIYHFGLNLGLAFQIQDDYLDIFGDEKKFGKKIGNDILEHKKTYLYIKALEKCKAIDKKRLIAIYGDTKINPQQKIGSVKQIFIHNKIDEEVQKEITNYTQKATKYLKNINIPKKKKEDLENFALKLIQRKI